MVRFKSLRRAVYSAGRPACCDEADMITEQYADHPIAVIVESTEGTMDCDEDGPMGWATDGLWRRRG